MANPARLPALRMTTHAWLLLLVLSVLWGGSFLFAKVAVAEVPPFTIVLVRVALASAILWAVLVASGQARPVDARLIRAFVLMGLLNNLIPFSLLVWGQKQIPVGLASILNSMTPVFTILVTHLFTADEKATGAKIAGVAAGILGVTILVGPDAVTGGGYPLLAQLACLAATLSYGLSGLVGRQFRDVPPLLTATGQLSATTLMSLPLVLLVDRPWILPAPSLQVVLALVALAILSTALAYVIYFRIMSVAGPSNVALVTLLIPVSAIVMGALVLGETLHPRHFAGMAVIALGLLIIDGRVLKLLRR